jgi:hypothetical protein
MPDAYEPPRDRCDTPVAADEAVPGVEARLDRLEARSVARRDNIQHTRRDPICDLTG